MEAAIEIRSISRRIEWRNHRHVARLSLQLDRGLPFDEKIRRRSSAVHSDRGIFDQAAATDADERPDFALSARCRSDRYSRDGRRNVERRGKSLRDLPRRFCRGERRPSGLSSLVNLQLGRKQTGNVVERVRDMEAAELLQRDLVRLPLIELEQANLLGGKVRI